jgi:hypothetical protein
VKLGDRRGELVLAPCDFDAHCREARVLMRRQGRPVLLEHTDSENVRLITRIWYPRGRWSSDWIWPYQERFRRALSSLEARGFSVPVERCGGRVAGLGIRFLIYRAPTGTSLRALLPRINLKTLAGYVASLHAAGVYSRSLHLGNVLARDDGGFAMVDVAATRILERPLSLRLRERNLGILCAHPQDLDFMLAGNWSDLVMEYCRAANLSLDQAASMRDRVRVQIMRRQARRRRLEAARWRGLPGVRGVLSSLIDR